MSTASSTVQKRLLPKAEIPKYDTIPLYMYTEKDSLNRITVLKETSKEVYLVAGRYSSAGPEGRFYVPLSDEDKAEIERMLRGSRKEATINYLQERLSASGH